MRHDYKIILLLIVTFSACSILPELYRSETTSGFMYWNEGVLKGRNEETTFLEIRDIEISINKKESNYRFRGRLYDRQSREWITGTMGAKALVGEIVTDTIRTYDGTVNAVHRIISREIFAVDNSGRIDASFSLRPNESFFVTCIGCTIIEFSSKK